MVPLFQRPYVWNEEDQWAPLWEDIRSTAEQMEDGGDVRPHFLGAIVLDQLRRPTGHVESRWIIDGQQRLTTIQVVLEAFADICRDLDQERYHKALVKLTRNDDPLSDTPDDQFKVWPTNIDQDHFRNVMLAMNPAGLKSSYGVRSDAATLKNPIADAYLYFYDAIDQWLHAGGADLDARVGTLYETMRTHIRLVAIDLGDDDDAQMIFETLNARGSPLLPADLVKNFLFYRADLEHQDIETLYKQYWEPFDRESGYWRKQTGRGHARRAKIDLFLLHYLTLKTRDPVKVGSIYQVFQEYALASENGSISGHLTSLRDYSGLFRRIDDPGIQSSHAQFFTRLRAMDITTAYPFALELLKRYEANVEAVGEVFGLLESFFVRRMVCQLPTRGYNRLFLELLDALDYDALEVAPKIKGFLLASDAESRRWPRDNEFKQNWVENPLYRVLQRGRLYMLLEALERGRRSAFTEDIEINGGLTIEHVMPQAWQANWPLPPDTDPEVAAVKRDKIIHTIGNLTLLTKKLNPSVSNGKWEDKRKAIREHSVLKLNIDLTESESWDEGAIEERGYQLFEVARTVWPIPDEPNNS